MRMVALATVQDVEKQQGKILAHSLQHAELNLTSKGIILDIASDGFDLQQPLGGVGNIVQVMMQRPPSREVIHVQ